MKHLSPKSMIAAVATAALLGTAAPAAVAAPHADRPTHAAKADRDAAKADRDADRDAARAERDGAKSSKAEARITRALTRLLDRNKLAKLEDVNEEAVRANIGADLAAVEAGMRPHVYQQVINQLRFAERLAVAAEADAAGSAAVAEVVTQLLAVTAVTPKADLRVTKRALQEWAYLLEDETEVEAPEEETELEQPADEAPADELPVEEAPAGEEPTGEAPADETAPVEDTTPTV